MPDGWLAIALLCACAHPVTGTVHLAVRVTNLCVHTCIHVYIHTCMYMYMYVYMTSYYYIHNYMVICEHAVSN